MRIKSETKHTITFIKHVKSTKDTESVSNISFDLGLNSDVVMKSLNLLLKAKIISRNKSGPTSRYIFPNEINLGDLINAIEGINCIDNETTLELIEMLNKIKV
jgi:DNA-binding IscR family transcriptional regulator